VCINNHSRKEKERKKANWFVMFAIFCDINTPTMADGKVPAFLKWLALAHYNLLVLKEKV
jgi:hypothetical protein